MFVHDVTMIWPTFSELSQDNLVPSSTDSSEHAILYYNMSSINIAQWVIRSYLYRLNGYFELGHHSDAIMIIRNDVIATNKLLCTYCVFDEAFDNVSWTDSNRPKTTKSIIILVLVSTIPGRYK